VQGFEYASQHYRRRKISAQLVVLMLIIKMIIIFSHSKGIVLTLFPSLDFYNFISLTELFLNAEI
jgi:hypothetical protein